MISARILTPAETIIFLLLFALVERFGVSRMQVFWSEFEYIFQTFGHLEPTLVICLNIIVRPEVRLVKNAMKELF